MKEILLALMSALVWGTAPLIFKIGLRGEVSPLAGIFFHNLTASVVALITMLALRENFSYPLRDVAVISFGGFVSGFLGLLLYYKAIKVGEVSVVAPIVASSPLWASLFAILFLGESFSFLKLIGTVLVVGGVVLITISKA